MRSYINCLIPIPFYIQIKIKDASKALINIVKINIQSCDLPGTCLLPSLERVHEIKGPTYFYDPVPKPCGENATAYKIDVGVPGHEDDCLLLSDGSECPPDNPVLVQDWGEPSPLDTFEHASIYVVRADASRLDVVVVLLHL